MAKKGDNSEGQRELLEIIEQVESLESERKQANEKIKATLKSAAGKGYEEKAIKQIVRDRKADADKTTKLRATVRRYMKQLGEFGDTELGEWAAAQMALQRSADNARPPKVVPLETETLQ